MEQHLLKTQIQEKIKGKTVKSLLFYTFNFEPIFFENYILPLFMPSQYPFSNIVIANQLLWRTCLQNGEMPEITVYCDDYVKNIKEAPTLGYEVRCLRIPAKTAAITNFHPKQIFILLENEEVIMVTGSGNITPAGWCSNVETFSMETLKKDTNHQFIIHFIENVAELSKKPFSKAENSISNALKTRNAKPLLHNWAFFNSIEQDFFAFLVEKLKEPIHKIEIISPFFSNDASLYQKLKIKYCDNICFLLPVLGGDEINMEEKTFDLLSKEGAKWYTWRESGLADRRNHAKIYRFYGQKKTYTIIGSVNFSKPAWGIYQEVNNSANIESAVLYTENNDNNIVNLLSSKEISILGKRFITLKDAENTENGFISRTLMPPDISFTLDWESRELSYEINVNLTSTKCVLALTDGNLMLKKGKYSLSLDNSLFKRLIKNSLIEVKETTKDGKTHLFYYYPTHLHIEQKPLGFHLPMNQILAFWQKLGEVEKMPSILRHIEDISDSETGELIKMSGDEPQLLNEWASNFSALINLEKYLKGKEEKEILHYLTFQSYDTIPIYLEKLVERYTENKVYTTFYWCILQIVKQNFYENRGILGSQLLKNEAIIREKGEIERLILKVEKEKSKIFQEEPQKWVWLAKQLKGEMPLPRTSANKHSR